MGRRKLIINLFQFLIQNKIEWEKADEIELQNCAIEVAMPILYAASDIYGFYDTIKKEGNSEEKI